MNKSKLSFRLNFKINQGNTIIRAPLQKQSTNILKAPQRILQNPKYTMQSESTHNHNQNVVNHPDEEQVVVFKFKRAFHQESYDQIKIQSKKVKPNPENVEKASKNYQKRNFIDKQTMLANLFQKLQLNPKTQLQGNKNQVQKPKLLEKPVNSFSLPLSSAKEFFLKKVQFSELPNINAQQGSWQQNSEIKNHMKQLKSLSRKQDLQQKFNRFRNIVTSKDKSIRVKYKIIDIKHSNLVNLNGQNFEYQDLSSQYTQSEKLSENVKYDYYILKKGELQQAQNKQTPQIILPQQAQYLLQDQADTKMQAQTPQNSKSDSNCQDRSDYQYPQEDYHEGESDKESQGIISGGKLKSDYGSEDENDDLNNSYQQEDDEEHYRQYLKRCKKQQEGDEEITYLYNFKSKYEDEDSDD